VYLPKFR
jgi:hypothetical protein